MLVQNVFSDGIQTSPYEICMRPPALSHWVLFLQFCEICDAVVVINVAGAMVVVGTIVVGTLVEGAVVVVLLAKVDEITVVVLVVLADGVVVETVCVVVDTLALVVVEIESVSVIQDTLHVDIINFSSLVNIAPCFT